MALPFPPPEGRSSSVQRRAAPATTWGFPPPIPSNAPQRSTPLRSRSHPRPNAAYRFSSPGRPFYESPMTIASLPPTTPQQISGASAGHSRGGAPMVYGSQSPWVGGSPYSSNQVNPPQGAMIPMDVSAPIGSFVAPTQRSRKRANTFVANDPWGSSNVSKIPQMDTIPEGMTFDDIPVARPSLSAPTPIQVPAFIPSSPESSQGSPPPQQRPPSEPPHSTSVHDWNPPHIPMPPPPPSGIPPPVPAGMYDTSWYAGYPTPPQMVYPAGWGEHANQQHATGWGHPAYGLPPQQPIPWSYAASPAHHPFSTPVSQVWPGYVPPPQPTEPTSWQTPYKVPWAASGPVYYVPTFIQPSRPTSQSKSTSQKLVEFFGDRLPRQVYLHLLLRLPALYFGRVARIFEDADLTLPEIKKMALETASEGRMDIQDFETHATMPPQYKKLKDTWEAFIDSVMREWKTLNIISVLLLSAILTLLQIDAAAADPVTRHLALFSLICSLISLLFGCMYIVRFGSMRKTYRAAEWALEAKKTKTVIWWNVWVLLAMPVVWLTWSIILYIACIMTFIWRTGPPDASPPSTISAHGLLVTRTMLSFVLFIGIIYACLVLATFRRYGGAMDRAWKARIDGWLEETALSPQAPPYSIQDVHHSPRYRQERQPLGTPRPSPDPAPVVVETTTESYQRSSGSPFIPPLSTPFIPPLPTPPNGSTPENDRESFRLRDESSFRNTQSDTRLDPTRPIPPGETMPTSVGWGVQPSPYSGGILKPWPTYPYPYQVYSPSAGVTPTPWAGPLPLPQEDPRKTESSHGPPLHKEHVRFKSPVVSPPGERSNHNVAEGSRSSTPDRPRDESTNRRYSSGWGLSPYPSLGGDLPASPPRSVGRMEEIDISPPDHNAVYPDPAGEAPLERIQEDSENKE
ncbi:hypothetical protein CPB83DRAFT_856456 [Crepidotus variabilis]|uniref:Uncharacterized protein n=1 Tax=Crepidotus variabilis TaxID=179855 RepID=A0A9P6EE60_9AGAR|nr:hypothetical protein CPB83DRAFT_856456 [Crepidotus variabilis]